jgi:hypothetical protein
VSVCVCMGLCVLCVCMCVCVCVCVCQDYESPFACVGVKCKLKKLSRAGHSNVGDHFTNYGALGKPYKGTGDIHTHTYTHIHTHTPLEIT